MNRYFPDEANIEERAVLIHIKQSFSHNLSALELYEVTRGVWKMNLKLHAPEIALAVFDGLVREVYTIKSYGPGGTDEYHTRNEDKVEDASRQEFSGEVAPDAVRGKYVLRSVRHLLPDNWQNPIFYVNC